MFRGARPEVRVDRCTSTDTRQRRREPSASPFDEVNPFRYSLGVATLKLGVLVSGSGTNLQAILDAVAAGGSMPKCGWSSRTATG